MNDLNFVSKEARIGKNVQIGPLTIIHDNVVIGDNCVIESHCVIGNPTKAADGKPLTLGANSHIRSHSVLYEGSTCGFNFVTGHAVLLRENTVVGVGSRVGSNAEVEGDCTIGNYTRIHSKVNIAKETTIGDLVWVFPTVQFTNDPLPPSNLRAGATVKDMAVIAAGALLLPGVTIGLGSFVGAGSVVRHDVPDAQFVLGDPARVIGPIDRLFSLKHGVSHPWPKHFRTGYPPESFPLMEEITQKINRVLEQLRAQKSS